MRQTPLLHGGTFGAAPSPQSLPPRSSRFIRILLVVWLVAGLGFVGYKSQPTKSKPVEAATLPVSPPVPPPVLAISTEDVLGRMTTAEAKITAATASLRRAEDQMARVVPSLERNYLWVEKNRLETAMTLTEAARREAEESRWEFDLLLNLLRKEHDSK
jgi:hypothetical protein